MDWKAVKPYLTAFVVAFIGGLFASFGVWLTYFARTNPEWAAIIGAGFAVLIGFAKVLTQPKPQLNRFAPTRMQLPVARKA